MIDSALYFFFLLPFFFLIHYNMMCFVFGFHSLLVSLRPSWFYIDYRVLILYCFCEINISIISNIYNIKRKKCKNGTIYVVWIYLVINGGSLLVLRWCAVISFNQENYLMKEEWSVNSRTSWMKTPYPTWSCNIMWHVLSLFMQCVYSR